MSSGSWDDVRHVLDEALEAGAFPGVVLEIGRTAGALATICAGRLGDDDEAPEASEATVYDLASLTKVVATASIFMRLVDRKAVSLDDPVARWLPEWTGEDRRAVTLGDLLAHSSGLTAHLPIYLDCVGRAEFQRAICTLPLEFAPRTASVYSDLGFMLLGFVAEEAARTPFDEQFAAIAADLAISDLTFRPPKSWTSRIAPTGIDTWRGRLLRGEVHDQNAWALGGVAGHAGLFGTAQAVGRFARAVLESLRSGSARLASPATVRTFAARAVVPGSSRALGWDTMRPTSSCGTRMRETAIGHTGFTGTSLWIDWEADVYVALLSNRVHPNADNDAILAVRPAVHNAVFDALSDRT